jgi:hypothetical protein
MWGQTLISFPRPVGVAHTAAGFGKPGISEVPHRAICDTRSRRLS